MEKIEELQDLLMTVKATLKELSDETVKKQIEIQCFTRERDRLDDLACKIQRMINDINK